MRIVFINYGHLAEQEEPEEVLDDFSTLTGWAEGVRSEGVEVVVVQGFTRDASLERRDVTYEMVAGSFAPRMSRWRIPRRLHRAVRRHAPDVVHLNGLLYPLQARDLRRALPAGAVLVAQHHAEKPERGLVAALQRWGLGAVDAFFFTGRELAEPWRQRGLIRPRQGVFEVLEGSTHFRMSDRRSARAATGMEGDPVCIWLGNLTPNKDPLTVLEGFQQLLVERPVARLYMAYRHGDLLAEVRARIASSSALRRAVTVLGTIPHEELEIYLNSADLFLLGSHYESCGYALVEATACGVVPVVTDIPSFRFITGRGTVGALWRPGDAGALRSAVLEVARRPFETQRREVRAHFERSSTYSAIGEKAVAAYRQLHEARSGGPRAAPRVGLPRDEDVSARRGASASAPSEGLLCPDCRRPIDPEALVCGSGHRFAEEHGVLVLLASDLAPRLRAFTGVLRDYREQEGRRILDERAYDALPHGAASDFEWRLRCFDLEVLRPWLAECRGRSVLDVGSFNGWLARHLADAGCEVTGVDYFDDPHDGLGARRFYARADWRSIQLDLRDLSILGRTYDVVVLNRCLQFFEDPAAYLEHAKERVTPGGLLVATGLDLYRDPRRKRLAVERLSRRHRERYGCERFLHPTRGYLDFEDRRRLRAAGMEIRPYPQLRWRSLRSFVLGDRPRFCYGVWRAGDEPAAGPESSAEGGRSSGRYRTYPSALRRSMVARS